MHQLGRETDGITGDGALPFQIQLAARQRRGDNLKAQFREQGVPEGKQLIHIQPHRNADFAARPLHRTVGEKLSQLVGIHVQLLILFSTASDRFFAAVSADKTAVAGKHVDGQRQWLLHRPQVVTLTSCLKFSRSSSESSVEEDFARDCA